MRILVFLFVTAAFVVPGAYGQAGATAVAATHAGAKSVNKTPKKRLRAFRSERELRRFLRKLAGGQVVMRKDMAVVAPAPAPKALASSDSAAVASNAGAAAAMPEPTPAEESVTNVQHAGVDEGDIVKLHGDQLVVLRRGRLFTVEIGGGALRPVSSLDAFGPDIDPEDAWYDELLVSDETVAVIGYSYERGGTEVGLFRIDRAGRLRYRATYQLRSDDYYSSRNYPSRLIGDKLVFYAPLSLAPDAENPFETFPALRRWHKGAAEGGFRRIVPATRVYRGAQDLSEAGELALHTVTVCDLARGDMSCAATALVGPPGSVFYVSPAADYVWASDWSNDEEEADTRSSSMLYRMPLDGSGPSALRVSGSPVDQFSFLESEDGNLNVLVRSDAAGDRMWNAEAAEGDVALLRVPLWSFSDGVEAASASSYRQLPKPQGDGDAFQNRFVGDYLLYGTGSGWDGPNGAHRSSLYAVRWATGENATVQLEHGVDRIEALGSDAVVVGADTEDLHFTSVRLTAGTPSVAGRYTRKGASQGELRSHGFFYKPEGPDSGLLGLPISTPGRPGFEHLFESSAAVLFLRNESLGLTELGELDARDETATDDECRASCVDWYGNARPLFLRGRVFALLGYEIVEGTLDGRRFVETRRISYAPRPTQNAAR
ncbi:MAG: beta-propeller domain-containing protein [Pyrinomonadaceae bacterium]